jgi:hypothetical protein
MGSMSNFFNTTKQNENDEKSSTSNDTTNNVPFLSWKKKITTPILITEMFYYPVFIKPI